jgi:hypothetical protein
MKRAICVFASVLLAIASPWAHGQAGPRAELQKVLNSSFKASTTYKISDLAANFQDVTTFGDMVVLHKGGLRVSALASSIMESNIYKNGVIVGGGAKRALSVLGNSITEGSDSNPPRTLAVGDRCWIEAIIVQKESILFKLFTDPDTSGMRYHGDLKFPFPNTHQVPSADEALKLIGEVLMVVTPGQPASAPKAAPAATAPPAPPQRQQRVLAPTATPHATTPPLPAPAPAISNNPTPTISIGQTRAQVIAIFGEPQRKAEAGTKEIFYYSDFNMKVTFINGIVSSID